MAELKPCPVCGKKPKIHYYPVNSGFAECKPIFRKPHLMAVVAWAPPSRLEEAIIEAWNRRAEDGNEKRLIVTCPDDCIKKTKRKTNFARIIVSGTAEKPYYDIMWFDYMDGQYHIGYGSYNLNFVFQWLSDCFEVEDAPTVDAVEVVRCKDCKHRRRYVFPFSDQTYTKCKIWGGIPRPDDFCSYGERKTE